MTMLDNLFEPTLTNAQLRGGYQMKASGKAAEVFLYGVIGSWWEGMTARDFVKALKDLDVDTIQLRVNSPGGRVDEAVAMMNALRRHKARVVATVDGLAASAASFLILAADEVVMGRGAEIMIHDAWAWAGGDAAALRHIADSLDKTSESVASIYAERAGGTAAEWRDLMLAETWYSDSEAVAAGLADRVEPLRNTADDDTSEQVIPGEDREDAIAALARASGFRYAGRASAPDPGMPIQRHGMGVAAGPRPIQTSALEALAALVGAATEPPAPPGGDSTPSIGEEAAPMSDLKKKLGERLGIQQAAAGEPSDEVILAALDEVLTEQAEPAPASPVLPPGIVAIDAEVLDELRTNAAAGREALARQDAAERERLVDAAVADGRILPRQKAGWLNKLEHEADGAEALAGLVPGLVPLAAQGYTGGVDEAGDEAVYPKEWAAGTREGA